MTASCPPPVSFAEDARSAVSYPTASRSLGSQSCGGAGDLDSPPPLGFHPRSCSVYTESLFKGDPRKASANAAKRGVTFADALAIFADADALDGPDVAHSASEARYLRLGRAGDGRVLMVAYTIRRHDDAETIRLISARRASRPERAAYAEED